MTQVPQDNSYCVKVEHPTNGTLFAAKSGGGSVINWTLETSPCWMSRREAMNLVDLITETRSKHGWKARLDN